MPYKYALFYNTILDLARNHCKSRHVCSAIWIWSDSTCSFLIIKSQEFLHHVQTWRHLYILWWTSLECQNKLSTKAQNLSWNMLSSLLQLEITVKIIHTYKQYALYLIKAFTVETLYYCNLLCYVKCSTSLLAYAVQLELEWEHLLIPACRAFLFVMHCCWSAYMYTCKQSAQSVLPERLIIYWERADAAARIFLVWEGSTH